MGDLEMFRILCFCLLGGGLSAKGFEGIDKFFSEGVIGEATLSQEKCREAKAAILAGAKKEALRLKWDEELEKRHVIYEYPAKLGPGKFEMNYHVCPTLGERPEGGWPLVIDLHGSGPLEMEYRVHQGRYRFYEGKFIVPRADLYEKTGHWAEAHFTAIRKLIAQMVLLEGVDPDRVYLMGFSEGANGIFRVLETRGPIDRFAGLAPSSGAGMPPVGNLLNTPFYYQWGKHDRGYDRNKVASKFAGQLRELEEEYPERVRFKAVEHDAGHQIPDHLAEFSSCTWMQKFARDPYPDLVLLNTSHGADPHHFWLKLNAPAKHEAITAKYKDNLVEIESEKLTSLSVRLNDEMVDYDKPVTVKLNGEVVFQEKLERQLSVMLETWKERRDPSFIFSSEVVLE